jgi:MscS family membrane protein
MEEFARIGCDPVSNTVRSTSKALTEHPKVETGPVPVRFIGIGTYSLDLEIFAYIDTSDGDEFLRIQQDLLLRILEEVEEAGTALALPTQAYYSVGGAPRSNGGSLPQVAAPRARR